MNELPQLRNTVAATVEAIAAAKTEIKQALDLLATASTRLKTHLDNYYDRIFDYNHGLSDGNVETPEAIAATMADVSDRINRNAWAIIAKRFTIAEMLSIKARAQFAAQLKAGELPELSQEAVFSFYQNMIERAPAMLEEMVAEVFDWLRPRGAHYKTNSEFDIGPRAIVRFFYASGWSNSFYLSEDVEQHILCLENVLLLLDNRPPLKFPGELVALTRARPKAPCTLDTEFLQVKVFGNGNAHLKFKRPDLIALLNQRAGGLRLYAIRQNPAA